LLARWRPVPETSLEVVPFASLDSWIGQQSQVLLERNGLAMELIEYTNSLKDLQWYLENLFQESSVELGLLSSPLKQLIKAVEEVINSSGLDQVSVSSKELSQKAIVLRPVFDAVEPSETVNSLLARLTQLLDLQRKFQERLLAAPLQTIQLLKQKNDTFQKAVKDYDGFQEQHSSLQERLEETEQRIQQKQEELSFFEKDPLHRTITETKEKKKALLQQREMLLKEISEILNRLQPLLLEYNRMAPHAAIVETYLENPLEAFLADHNLSIIHILQHLDALIKAGRITLQDGHQHLFQKALDLRHLQHLQKEYSGLQHLSEQQPLQRREKDFMMRVQELEYKLEHYRSQRKKLQRAIKEMDDTLEHSKESRRIQKNALEDLLTVSTGKKVSIVF